MPVLMSIFFPLRHLPSGTADADTQSAPAVFPAGALLLLSRYFLVQRELFPRTGQR